VKKEISHLSAPLNRMHQASVMSEFSGGARLRPKTKL
jgi:hypothetical protein